MTITQQKALEICEVYSHIYYEGDIDDEEEIEQFLIEHYQEAKLAQEEMLHDYEDSLRELSCI